MLQQGGSWNLLGHRCPSEGHHQYGGDHTYNRKVAHSPIFPDVRTSVSTRGVHWQEYPVHHVQYNTMGDGLYGASGVQTPMYEKRQESGPSSSVASMSDGVRSDGERVDVHSNASTHADFDRIDAERDFRFKASQQGDDPVELERARRNILSALRAAGQDCHDAHAPRSDPQPLSTDELALWRMSVREDAEIGADVHNQATFGDDANKGWSFEENLAANERLQGLVRRAREGESAETVKKVQRLRCAIREVVQFVMVEPPLLKQVLTAVAREGWENVTWKNNYTALHVAAEYNCCTVLPLLVGLGADVRQRTSKGSTALDVARRKGHTECARALQRLEVAESLEDVVAVAAAMRGALMTSEALGYFAQTVGSRQLLGAGAKFGAPAVGWGPSLADQLERLNFVLYEMVSLLNIGKELSGSIIYVASTGCTGIPVPGWYTTVLHLAAERGQERVIPLLIQLGADPMALDSAGRTPLDAARSERQWSVIWALEKAMGREEGTAAVRRSLAPRLAPRQTPAVRQALPPAGPPDGDDLLLIPRPRFV